MNFYMTLTKVDQCNKSDSDKMSDKRKFYFLKIIVHNPFCEIEETFCYNANVVHPSVHKLFP